MTASKPSNRPVSSMSVRKVRPSSRRELRIRSKNPKDAPWIEPNYHANEEYRQIMVRGFKMSRKLAASQA
ncbi:hypothetical protein ACV35H_33835, partial [Pseudomonas aeruginosa]